ncbi:MAG: hypothetical protein K8F30_01060, partial [Taibaiella sp.]|nr:hypothetical protein [Taibaiella sp.]
INGVLIPIGTNDGNENTIYGAADLDIDSLYIQRNRVYFQGKGAGGVNGHDGTVRNLHVTDNFVGDSLVQDARGMIFQVTLLSHSLEHKTPESQAVVVHCKCKQNNHYTGDPGIGLSTYCSQRSPQTDSET